MYRVLKIALALFIVVLLGLIAVPKFLSSSYVKQQVEAQLSEMLGRKVSLNGNSSVSLRPYLGVSYRNVTVRQRGGETDKPLIAVDGMQAKLGLLSMIWGDPQVVEVQLLRPRFDLRIDKDGSTNWTLEKGPLAQRLALPEGEKPTQFPLGTVIIEDGIVELADERYKTTEMLTSLNGTVSWPEIASGGSAALEAVWRGEVVEMKATASSPFEILRGGSSKIAVTFSANPLSLTFDGLIDTADVPFAKGTLDTATPSPRRLAEWFGQNIPAVELLAELSIKGEVSATAEKMDFPSVVLKVGQNEGTGQLQLVRNEDEPVSANGTLAFESLTISDLKELTLAGGTEEIAQSPSTDLDFLILKGMNVDIQLSANTGKIGPLDVENLAASVVIDSGKASFDVGQAQALNGDLSGSLSMGVKNNVATVAADIVLKDIDLAELASLYGANDIALEGSGSATFNLKSVGANPKALLRKLKGNARIAGTDGVFKGIDLEKLANATDIDDVDSFEDDIFSGETAYSELNIELFLSNGIAYLRDSKLISSGFKTFLTGRTDLPRRSLALSGRVVKPTGDTAGNSSIEALQFFIGGTTSSPLLVPLSVTKKSQATPDDAPSGKQTEVNN